MDPNPKYARNLRILAGIVGGIYLVLLAVWMYQRQAYKAHGQPPPDSLKGIAGLFAVAAGVIGGLAAKANGRDPLKWGLASCFGAGVYLATLPQAVPESAPPGNGPSGAARGPSNTSAPVETDLVVRITSGPQSKAYVGEHDRLGSDALLSLPDFDVVEESAHLRAAMLDRTRARAAREAGLSEEQVAREARRTTSGAPSARSAEELGSALFDALFRDRKLFALYDGWKKKPHRGCIRLQIDPRWAPVAWETLRETEGGSGVFLGMDEATPLVREAATTTAFPDPVDLGPGGLSVLAAGVNPIDLPQLALDRERRLLEEALSGVGPLTWVSEGEEALRRELRRPEARHHVFHFAGHGSFDGKEGFVYLGRGKSAPISAEDLASMLLRCETLRLVVLNACDGAAAGTDADSVSVAERLVQRGIPAVLAMTSPILDETALQIVRDFYHALSHGRPVQHAVNDLRLHLERNQLEWAAPVLVMGSPRVPLFTRTARSAGGVADS